MASENEEKTKSFFESRLMSILLMACLLIMCALFIIVVWQLFGNIYGLRVTRDLGIGIGSGVIVVMFILLISKLRNAQPSKNVLLYLVGGILLLSLIVSLILKYSISDPETSSWAFISTSAIGLGITTGIAITYLILAMFRSKLVYGYETKGQEAEIEEQKPADETKEEVNK